MRAAPAVELTVAPDRRWRAGVAVLLLATLAALLAWAAMADSVSLRWRGAVLLLALPLLAWLAWCERAERALRLRWDGQAWHWRDLAAPACGECRGRVAVVADLGVWLLLRLHPVGSASGTRWLAVSRRAMPSQWQALRRAVYSAAPSPSLRGDPPPSGPHER